MCLMFIRLHWDEFVSSCPPSKGHWWNFARGCRHDSRGGLTGLLGVVERKKIYIQESNLSRKIARNGSNSKNKTNKKWSLGLSVAHNLCNINKYIPQSWNGSADWLCQQQDHSSTRRALLQHQRDSCDFPPFLRILCFSLLMNFSSATWWDASSVCLIKRSKQSLAEDVRYLLRPSCLFFWFFSNGNTRYFSIKPRDGFALRTSDAADEQLKSIRRSANWNGRRIVHILLCNDPATVGLAHNTNWADLFSQIRQSLKANFRVSIAPRISQIYQRSL